MNFKQLKEDKNIVENTLLIPIIFLTLITLISILLTNFGYSLYYYLKGIFICLSAYYILLGLIIGIVELKNYLKNKK